MPKYGIISRKIKALPVREAVARGKFLGELPGGTVCEVLDCAQYVAGRGNPKAGGWFEVRYGGIRGWCIARYVDEYIPSRKPDRITIEIGIMAPDLTEQLKGVLDADEASRFEVDSKAISRLNIRDLIGDYLTNQARQKLVRKIEAAILRTWGDHD
jgi:hypothetical protein